MAAWLLAAGMVGAAGSADAQEVATAKLKGLYVGDAGDRWCVTVLGTDVGVDGRRWSWVSIDADPRRLLHLPSDNIEPVRSCTAVAATRPAQPSADRIDRAGATQTSTSQASAGSGR